MTKVGISKRMTQFLRVRGWMSVTYLEELEPGPGTWSTATTCPRYSSLNSLVQIVGVDWCRRVPVPGNQPKKTTIRSKKRFERSTISLVIIGLIQLWVLPIGRRQCTLSYGHHIWRPLGATSAPAINWLFDDSVIFPPAAIPSSRFRGTKCLWVPYCDYSIHTITQRRTQCYFSRKGRLW